MKEEVASLKMSIEAMSKNFVKTMEEMQEKLVGSEARIKVLEAEIKNVMETVGNRLPAMVTAPGLTAPQSKPNGEACRWHKYKPDSCVVPKYAGSEEKDVDAWVAHLGNKTVGSASETCGTCAE